LKREKKGVGLIIQYYSKYGCFMMPFTFKHKDTENVIFDLIDVKKGDPRGKFFSQILGCKKAMLIFVLDDLLKERLFFGSRTW
jgi:hypothetical protein